MTGHVADQELVAGLVLRRGTRTRSAPAALGTKHMAEQRVAATLQPDAVLSGASAALGTGWAKQGQGPPVSA